MSCTEMKALRYLAIVAIVVGAVHSYSTTPFYTDMPDRGIVCETLDTSGLQGSNPHVSGPQRGTSPFNIEIAPNVATYNPGQIFTGIQ